MAAEAVVARLVRVVLHPKRLQQTSQFGWSIVLPSEWQVLIDGAKLGRAGRREVLTFPNLSEKGPGIVRGLFLSKVSTRRCLLVPPSGECLCLLFCRCRERRRRQAKRPIMTALMQTLTLRNRSALRQQDHGSQPKGRRRDGQLRR
jgi:hypothetical protein